MRSTTLTKPKKSLGKQDSNTQTDMGRATAPQMKGVRKMKDCYIGTAEVIARLGCGRTFANELMHKFEARGQAYKVGRLYKVKEKTLTD